MVRLPRLLLAAIAMSLSVAGTASAAPVVTLDQACYAHLPGRGSQPIVATITGGTPGAEFVLTARGKGGGTAGSASGTFDPAGNAVAQIDGATPPSGTTRPTKGQVLELFIQDLGADGADTPVGTTLITTIAMQVAAKPRNPQARRRIRVSAGRAFAGKILYGFVTKPGSGRVLRRIRLGRANVCGFVSTRATVAPRGRGAGSYVLFVNAGRRLDKPRAIAFTFRIIRF
ncbi:MAG TPA: hypothetical protein VGW10_17625 [Solirubrobacteraceae bacterium]|nr:hypothetical protein [Solirubrobacteraceae bacterium]